MTSEVTYAEVRFKNEPQSLGTKSEPPAEKETTKEVPHTVLECMKENSTTEENTWDESEKRCSRMKAHLLVINTKDEQDIITRKLKINSVYYVGLSDPEGKRHWQWVDQTPYNESATF
eukprot:bmy_05553T0